MGGDQVGLGRPINSSNAAKWSWNLIFFVILPFYGGEQVGFR